jgi:hypothetical protein
MKLAPSPFMSLLAKGKIVDEEEKVFMWKTSNAGRGRGAATLYTHFLLIE